MSKERDWARCAVVASSCAVIAAVAGCSGSADGSLVSAGASPASVTTAASRTASAAATAPAGSAKSVAPLTGLSVSSVIAQRPAVAVVVASPDPVGLGSANVVFEERASPVRYLAVFQSDEADKVGPVTSTRPTDGQALSVLHPLIGYNGGTSAFISILDATKIIDDGYQGHSSLYSAGPGGLSVSTSALAAAGRSDGSPPPLFSYRVPGSSLASARETHPTSVRVDIPGQPPEQWSYDARADRWVETAGGPRVSVANLVVQIVSFKTVYLSRRYGETTQSARVIGTGQVAVFSAAVPGGNAGTAAEGSWYKPGIAAITNYFDAAHVPMNFAPGPTWIVLAPAGTRTSQAGTGQA